MRDVAIRVEGLGKQYRIGRRQSGYKTIREQLIDWTKSPFRRASRLMRGQGSAAELDETIWALRDISFEINRGDAVGVIGRNGAGKTTLLKVLSRITDPTEGDAWIHGRVGSLLEVGTGFHPELTGRENIYLNGAILGMKREEIDRQFDEIVDFSGIEKFIDTPVKHYSSGMSVRLAFSVAAYMEPEILLVDEVLAVGDSEFQKKCLGKMSDVAKGGRTVLFVSHNMAAIESMTNISLCLGEGVLKFFGPSSDTISYYTKSGIDKLGQSTVDLNSVYRIGPSSKRLMQSLTILSGDKATNSIRMGKPISLEMNYEAPHLMDSARIGIGINTVQGMRILSVNSEFDSAERFRILGQGKIVCDLGCLPLAPGDYEIILNVEENPGQSYEQYPVAGRFEILSTNVHDVDFHTISQQGVIYWKGNWSLLN